MGRINVIFPIFVDCSVQHHFCMLAAVCDQNCSATFATAEGRLPAGEDYPFMKKWLHDICFCNFARICCKKGLIRPIQLAADTQAATTWSCVSVETSLRLCHPGGVPAAHTASVYCGRLVCFA